MCDVVSHVQACIFLPNFLYKRFPRTSVQLPHPIYQVPLPFPPPSHQFIKDPRAKLHCMRLRRNRWHVARGPASDQNCSAREHEHACGCSFWWLARLGFVQFRSLPLHLPFVAAAANSWLDPVRRQFWLLKQPLDRSRDSRHMRVAVGDRCGADPSRTTTFQLQCEPTEWEYILSVNTQIALVITDVDDQ